MKAFFVFIALSWVGSSQAGEILYNGIRLPDDWPPRNMDPVSAAPMDVPYLQNIPAVIPIDVGRQLFFDDFLIEKTDLRRAFHQAENYSGNPVLKAETDTEIKGGLRSGTQEAAAYLINGGVFWDPAAEMIKMWYHAGWRGGLAMATSRDGLHWERAKLPGKLDNLILPVDRFVDDSCIWLDLNAADPAERVKMLLHDRQPRNSNRGNWHDLFVSPDGIEWSAPVRAGKASDYCSFFYNPFRNVWVYSIKRERPGSKERCRFYAEGHRFVEEGVFNRSVFWLGADELDVADPALNIKPELYSLNAVAYESVLVGLFSIFLGPPNEVAGPGKIPKTIDLKIGFSRDGFHWDRSERKPFLASSRQEGTWNRAYLHSTGGVCLVAGDKLYFPYTAASGVAPSGKRGLYTGLSIGIAMLRRDGFASMDAASEGTLTTRPVAFKGKHLFVNAVSRGELRAEILDEAGNVIAPYSLENSQPFTGDATLQEMKWKDAPDLSVLSGHPVRFRFRLREGSLYSFWVSPDASGASYGYVAAGGPGYTGNRDTVGKKALEDGM